MNEPGKSGSLSVPGPDRRGLATIAIGKSEVSTMTKLAFKLTALWAVVAGGFFALVPPARAAEPEWKIGLAQVKVTPERPVFLAGYASRNKPFEKVEADLYAKALALEDRDGHRV